MIVATLLVILGVVIFCIFHSTANDNTYTTWDSEETQPVYSHSLETAEFKGKDGELAVSRELLSLPSEEYIVLNDVLLPTKYNSNQLDHIVISLYGIFVIETKNYSGRLYGGKHSEKWTQYIGREKYSLYNPLLQNERHAQVVADYTHVSKNAIFPIVVFTGSATVKPSADNNIVYLEDLLCAIKQHQHQFFSNEQIHLLAKSLDDAMEENSETMFAHIRSVKETKRFVENETSSGNCPQCDGFLILRHGRYGDFFGCSNYPRCKYTRNINTK